MKNRQFTQRAAVDGNDGDGDNRLDMVEFIATGIVDVVA